jgi:hypothetical protein
MYRIEIKILVYLQRYLSLSFSLNTVLALPQRALLRNSNQAVEPFSRKISGPLQENLTNVTPDSSPPEEQKRCTIYHACTVCKADKAPLAPNSLSGKVVDKHKARTLKTDSRDSASVSISVRAETVLV